MWEYLATLVLGFWLGVAALLYAACYWLDDLLDLSSQRVVYPSEASSGSRLAVGGAHARLQRLVARALREAAALQPLPAPPRRSRAALQPLQPLHAHRPASTYEDLLATAVLNQVIERKQRGRSAAASASASASASAASAGRSSGIHSASASPSPSPTPTTSPEPTPTPTPSPHPCDRSFSRSPPAHASRIPFGDVTPPLHEDEYLSEWEKGYEDEGAGRGSRMPRHKDDEERDFDEVSGGELQAVDGTWEENWLFQKKKIKSVQSVPVPMLVPSAGAGAAPRPRIGERDAPDTSDLSDLSAHSGHSDLSDLSGHSDLSDAEDEPRRASHANTGIHDVPDFEPDSLTIVEGSHDFERLIGDEYEQNEKAVDDIINEIYDEDSPVVETDKLESGKLVLGIDSGPLRKAEFALKEEIHRMSLDNGTKKLNKVMKTWQLNNGDIHKNSKNTISQHEREGEYEETVTMPVQKHADSLRRKHFEDAPHEVPTRDTDQEQDLIPGSIAYRERNKWLNYVEMPNNPYSPEAIKKRLSVKSTSSLFDTIAARTMDVDDDDSIETCNDIADCENIVNKQGQPIKIANSNRMSLNLSTEHINRVDRTSKSPSPKVLRDVAAEEVPQYKRYGRDYYIREAKASSGGRKTGSVSDTSSISSMNKSTSLDNFDTEFASPGLLIKQFNIIATNQQYTKFAGKDSPVRSITTTSNNDEINCNVFIEYEDANENLLFSAKPVIVDDDTDKRFEEILQSAYKSDINTEREPVDEPMKSPISVDNSYISSSSMEDSIKIYNVQTGEIMKCKPEDTLSVRYEADSYGIDMADNNISRNSVDSVSLSCDADDGALGIENRQENFEINELDDLLSHLPKVKELAKKFVSMDNLHETTNPPQVESERREGGSKGGIRWEWGERGERGERHAHTHTHMHSLTARSISKQFRDELRLSRAAPAPRPARSDVSADVSARAADPAAADVLPEPGTIKSKLAFFESLKNKFTTNK